MPKIKRHLKGYLYECFKKQQKWYIEEMMRESERFGLYEDKKNSNS